MIKRLGRHKRLGWRLKQEARRRGLGILGVALVLLTGCVPKISSDLPYPEDFSSTIRLIDQTAPNRSMRVVIEPNRWLRATVGQDAPASRRYPPRTVQLTDADLASIHDLLAQLPAKTKPYVAEDTSQGASPELTTIYFANNKAHFAAAEALDTYPPARELAELLWDAVGLPEDTTTPE